MFNLFNDNKLISFHRNPYSRFIFRTSRITSTIYFYSCVYFCAFLFSFCLHPLFPNISVQLLNRRGYGAFCWKESPFTFRKMYTKRNPREFFLPCINLRSMLKLSVTIDVKGIHSYVIFQYGPLFVVDRCHCRGMTTVLFSVFLVPEYGHFLYPSFILISV